MSSYFATVNKEVFAYNDCWWHYDFAKSRGVIHSHSAIFSVKHAQKIEAAIQHSTETETSDSIESDSADKLHKWLQTTHSDEKHVFAPNFICMHPGVVHESVTESGNREWVQTETNGLHPREPLAKIRDHITFQEGGVSKLNTSC